METEENLTAWQRSGAMTRRELGILSYRPTGPFVGVWGHRRISPVCSGPSGPATQSL